ncbi:VDE1 [Symbiodinium sp. CCMP2592]|nr:VDE1 [Symbiodinium sp. CCMP2592]
MLIGLAHLLTISQLAVSTEALPDPRCESCNVSRPDGGDTAFLQTVKASGEPISPKEFAEKMQCHPQANSFFINGGDLVWVMNPNPGVLWGDLLLSWERGGPQNKPYVGIDYTFMSQSYQFTDYLTLATDVGVTVLPMTLWIQQTIKLSLTLPIPTGCNDFWNKGSGGLYIFPPWELEAVKSPGFDDAGWPKSLDARDTIVESLAFRIRFKPKLKIIPGATPDAPPIMELRLSFYLEFRPIFRSGVVREICSTMLHPGSEGSDGTPSMSFHLSRIDEAPAALSQREWFAESAEWPEKLTIPAGVLFDTSDVRTLLSTNEMQRVQDFKDTVDEQTVPPENVSVTDGDCAEPFAIGGGCKCKRGCSPLPYLNSDFASDRSLSCDGPWPPPGQLVALRKTICGPRKVYKAFKLGKTAQPGGIVAICKVGTLIGGACSKLLPYDGAEILAAFPEDQSRFRCLGGGEWSEQPDHQTVAHGWCLELEGNEKVIIVRREGRDTASAKCPEGYQIVGGGCTFIEGLQFTLRESYPTLQNTWECIFSSTQSCGEGSPLCLRSEARAMCLGIASAQ